MDKIRYKILEDRLAGGSQEMRKYVEFAFEFACQRAEERGMEKKGRKFVELCEEMRELYLEVLWQVYRRAAVETDSDNLPKIRIEYNSKTHGAQFRYKCKRGS